jgi:hypothetical protein
MYGVGFAKSRQRAPGALKSVPPGLVGGERLELPTSTV